jgi:hypothetical protein
MITTPSLLPRAAASAKICAFPSLFLGVFEVADEELVGKLHEIMVKALDTLFSHL